MERLPRLLTVPEVAAVLRVSDQQAYKIVQRGEIPGVRVGARSVRVMDADLIDYLRARRERPE